MTGLRRMPGGCHRTCFWHARVVHPWPAHAILNMRDLQFAPGGHHEDSTATQRLVIMHACITAAGECVADDGAVYRRIPADPDACLRSINGPVKVSLAAIKQTCARSEERRV